MPVPKPKKMTKNEEATFYAALDLSTKKLMALPPRKRKNYVVSIIRIFGHKIVEIFHIKDKVKKIEAIQLFIQDLDENAAAIIPPTLYMIKPEFTDCYTRLQQSIGNFFVLLFQISEEINR